MFIVDVKQQVNNNIIHVYITLAGADHDPEEEEVQAFNEMMADFNQEAAGRTVTCGVMLL